MPEMRLPAARGTRIMRAKRERQHRRGSIGVQGLLMLLLPALNIATLARADPASAPAQSAAADTACPDSATSRAAVATIDERLEITLKDGRTLRLAGLEPPRPTPDAPDFDATARDALKARSGAEIGFVPQAGQPDRWGRIPAFVFFDPSAPGTPPVSAAQFLLAGGFAGFMPELAARPCRTVFLAAEGAARKAKLGLWRDPFTPSSRRPMATPSPKGRRPMSSSSAVSSPWTRVRCSRSCNSPRAARAPSRSR